MLFTDGPGIEAALEQKEKEPVPGPSVTAQAMDIDMPIRDDGFGGHLGQDIICKQDTTNEWKQLKGLLCLFRTLVYLI